MKPAAYLIGLLLLAASTLAHARGLAELPADAVIVDPHALSAAAQRESAAAVKQARTALASGPAAALAYVATIKEPLSQASAAAALIDDLQAGEGNADARAVLQQLAQTPLRVFQRHEETAADWFLPYIDVAGRARFALTMLDARVERERWSRRWQTEPAATLVTLASLDAASQGHALEALGELPEESVGTVFAASIRAPEVQVPALWPVLAAATRQRAAFHAASTYSADRDILGLLAATYRLPDADAVDWLTRLIARPKLASAALLALSAHAEHGSLAWQRLVDALDDPALAPSAAAALAQRGSSQRVAEIAELVADASPHRLFGIVLALRLEGSPAALAILDSLRNDARLPLTTRMELAR